MLQYKHILSIGNIQYKIIKRDVASNYEVIMHNLENKQGHTLHPFDELENAKTYLENIQRVAEGRLTGEQYDYPNVDMALFKGFHALICPICKSGTYSSWALLRHLKEKHDQKENEAIQAVTEEIKNNDSDSMFRVEL